MSNEESTAKTATHQPTMNLRFVLRPTTERPVRILQQMFVPYDWDKFEEEWRDVQLAIETPSVSDALKQMATNEQAKIAPEGPDVQPSATFTNSEQSRVLNNCKSQGHVWVENGVGVVVCDECGELGFQRGQKNG